jgi:hypothetical protein
MKAVPKTIFPILVFSFLLFQSGISDAVVDPGSNSYSDCIVYRSNLFPLADYEFQEVFRAAESAGYIYISILNESHFITHKDVEAPVLRLAINNLTVGAGTLRSSQSNPYYYTLTFFPCDYNEGRKKSCYDNNIDGNAAYLAVTICENSRTATELSSSLVSELKKLGMLETEPPIVFGQGYSEFHTASGSGGGLAAIEAMGTDPLVLTVIIIVVLVVAVALVLRRLL